jgi:hypothetical protein
MIRFIDTSLQYLTIFFFRFRGGRPLHKFHFLISRNPLDLPTARFPIYSPRVSLRVLLNSLLLCSCSLWPRFLIPFLRSGFGWCLLPNVCIFTVPRTTLALVRFSPMTFPLRRATFARWVVALPAAVNFFRDQLRTSGPPLWLLAALCGQIPAPTALPQSSDRFHCGMFPGGFLMLPSGLHVPWICLHVFSLGLRVVVPAAISWHIYKPVKLVQVLLTSCR